MTVVFVCSPRKFNSNRTFLDQRSNRPYLWTEGTIVRRADSFWSLKRQVKRYLAENPSHRVVFRILRKDPFYAESEESSYLLCLWKRSDPGAENYRKADQFTYINGNLVREMSSSNR